MPIPPVPVNSQYIYSLDNHDQNIWDALSDGLKGWINRFSGAFAARTANEFNAVASIYNRRRHSVLTLREVRRGNPLPLFEEVQMKFRDRYNDRYDRQYALTMRRRSQTPVITMGKVLLFIGAALILAVLAAVANAQVPTPAVPACFFTPEAIVKTTPPNSS
jgi:hypothetical protein